MKAKRWLRRSRSDTFYETIPFEAGMYIRYLVRGSYVAEAARINEKTRFLRASQFRKGRRIIRLWIKKEPRRGFALRGEELFSGPSLSANADFLAPLPLQTNTAPLTSH